MTLFIAPRQIQEPFGAGLVQPNVLVLGLGESGLAMAKWAGTQGAKVFVHDTRSEESLSDLARNNAKQLIESGVTSITYGSEIPSEVTQSVQLIGVSPGMSPLQEPIKSLIEAQSSAGYQIWGELEFFSQALQSLKTYENYQPKVLAVTGTNGKTTTTALTGTICSRAGKHVAVAGNISPSLLDKLMMCLTPTDVGNQSDVPSDSDASELATSTLPEIWALELSSFQLFYSNTFNPTAAVLLNISQDHLDWHGDFEHYLEAKSKIFGADTVVILNRDDPKVIALADSSRFEKSRVVTFGIDAPLEMDSFGIVGDMGVGGFDWLAWVEPDIDFFPEEGKRRRKNKNAEDAEPIRVKRLIPADALLIKGRHNAANALASLALAQAAGMSMGPLLHGLREYRGEPHRVQSIAVIRDVEYIDDSKGTNVGATIAALQGLGLANAHSDRRKIILIAGGEGKGQDFSLLTESIRRFAKSVILIGRDAGLIRSATASSGIEFIDQQTLEQAVVYAASIAVSGDIVLLSPACASFDMFKDYAHRAHVFADAVQELTMQSSTEHSSSEGVNV
jgi:UDP-N-acetylmuramoylalanine--D-glutamate ligase